MASIYSRRVDSAVQYSAATNRDMLLLSVVVSLSVFWGTLVDCQSHNRHADYDHLDSVLLHYNTLHINHLSHTVTTLTTHTHTRRITFSSLGRDFQLHLKPNKRFTKDFAAYSVDSDGIKHRFHVNTDEYYHGYLHGEESSRVTAHVSEGGVLSAYIHTPNETYHIEPSSHYISQSHSFHMITYRESNVRDRLKNARVDYNVAPSVSDNSLDKSQFHSSLSDSHFSLFDSHSRLRRQSFPGQINADSCSIILVADFTVFEFLRERSSVVSRLIQLVLAIDTEIYRSTQWITDSDGTTVTGLGMDIKEVRIHETGTSDPMYNTPNPTEAGDLLGFMRFSDWSEYCLAHLFTNRDFSTGLLGLANIASSSLGQTGGICSSRFRDHALSGAPFVIYNTGLTTFRNRGQQMVMSELVRVTGHELGHSWGSHHDNSVCGRGWLMNEYAQDGREPTHSEFSSCSRTSIGQVLLTKGFCFQSQQPECGDYRVEGDEECDVGEVVDDPCCRSNCTFRNSTFTCSDQNSACCLNCQAAPTTVLCRIEREITFNCVNDTYCNGVDVTCPEESPQANDGAPCINGVCRRNGTNVQCMELCQSIDPDMTLCTCPGDNECLFCCGDINGCAPALFGNTTAPLSNGVPCDGGMSVCINGECTRTTQDEITRIWNIVVNLDTNAFGIFVRENIVGWVLIFSLLLWCPLSCVVHYGYDRRLCGIFKKKDNDEPDLGMWYEERINAYNSLKRGDTEMAQPLLVPMTTVDEEPYEEPVDTLPPPSYS